MQSAKGVIIPTNARASAHGHAPCSCRSCGEHGLLQRRVLLGHLQLRLRDRQELLLCVPRFSRDLPQTAGNVAATARVSRQRQWYLLPDWNTERLKDRNGAEFLISTTAVWPAMCPIQVVGFRV